MTNEVRVRYAPSPTGQLHIGGARTALFNYLFARHHGGKFIVRIEDTDIERNIEGGELSQLDNLRWLGIDYDESVDIGGPYAPYRQMERLDIYSEHAEKMLAEGHAYKCFCSSEELEAERDRQKEAGIAAPMYNGKCRHLSSEEVAAKEAEGIAHTIRMRVPADVTYTIEDLVRGTVTFESKDVGDWVLVKANGIPTYNYAVVLDDYFMKISHVLRGEEHLSNTPKQIMVFDAFGWTAPKYGHMTLIINESRKKLSKRDESIIQFITQYKNLGYLPEAMFNFFALLGWSPEGEEEIFSKDQLIEMFDEKRLSKSPSMFDTNKLTWMNNQYMKKLSTEEVAAMAIPHLQQAGKLPEQLTSEQQDWADRLVGLYQEQMSFGAEIVELSELFFTVDIPYDDEAMAVLNEEQVPAVMAAFKAQIEQMETFEADGIKAAIKAVQKETGAKGKGLFMPIRVVSTGQTHGPDLPNAIALLGKEKVIARVEKFAKQ